MNQAVLPIKTSPEEEPLALRALKNSNLGAEVATARDGVEFLGCPLGGDRSLMVLPNVVKLPKVNELEVLRRLRDDERTKALPLLVLTNTHPPYAPNERGDDGSVRGPVTSDEFGDLGQRLGLHWLIKNEASPEDRRPSC